MKKIALLLSFALLAGVAQAQQVTSFTKKSGFTAPDDIFQSNLYSADRIMEKRDQLDLTDAQADAIKKIHAETAGEFSTLKWDLDDETKKLREMLSENKPNASAVQQQMDKVLALENELKKKKLEALVAIKSELNDDQIETLKESITVVRGSYFYNTDSDSQIKIVNGKVATGVTSGFSTIYPDSKNNKVMIRMNSDESGNQPLFVVKSDGEEFIGESSKEFDLDPDSIESISVLKDKSAETAYGERGKDGVVVITLKKGTEVKKKKNK